MPCHAVPAAIISPLEKNLSTYLSIYPLIHPSIQQDRLIDSWRTIRGMVYLLVYHHLQPPHYPARYPHLRHPSIHPISPLLYSSSPQIVSIHASPPWLYTPRPRDRDRETERPKYLTIFGHRGHCCIVARSHAHLSHTMLARLRALVNLHHHQPIPVVRLLASYASSRSYSTVVGTAAHEGYASLVRPVPSIKLNELHDNKGANKPRLRVGRGPGSGKGKTCGRGHKGTGQREAGMHAGFEGGQFPMYRRVQKFGFKNLYAHEISRYFLSLPISLSLSLSLSGYLSISLRIEISSPSLDLSNELHHSLYRDQ